MTRPTRQSDERVPGRRGGGPPPSFGRGDDKQAEDFTIRGGQAIHVVVHAQVVPDADSLNALRAAIAESTRQGVLDGYAQALAQMDEPEDGTEEQPPGDGNGGTPPGGADAGG